MRFAASSGGVRKARETDRKIFTAEQRQKILALAAEFPKVWNDPGIAYRERKRMVRLLLEDVTLHKGDNILVQVRFKGGALRTLELPSPLPFCVAARTKPEVIDEIDRLLGEHTYEEIVEILNARGFRSGEGRVFNLSILGRLCKKSGLKSRRQRLREAGLITRLGPHAAQSGGTDIITGRARSDANQGAELVP
jgi:hypothetical protein